MDLFLNTADYYFNLVFFFVRYQKKAAKLTQEFTASANEVE
jgi:hypothetical protein